MLCLASHSGFVFFSLLFCPHSDREDVVHRVSDAADHLLRLSVQHTLAARD